MNKLTQHILEQRSQDMLLLLEALKEEIIHYDNYLLSDKFHTDSTVQVKDVLSFTSRLKDIILNYS